ncbi:MAG TPA: sigma-70 family RNA polymerase sigma factor [Candidatus Polarisedimenticolaceae bacterium]|nr:sigma-70 family RNA polymerase sigma factor [Candidatus Polarisedimenticolaceae bacterium]
MPYLIGTRRELEEDHPPGEITRLLLSWRQGDAGAVNRLFPLVYEEMQLLARRLRRRSGPGASLDTRGLVHEAYLRLVDQTHADIGDRQHFFAVAAKAMRHILVDHARARTALKRGGGAIEAALDEPVLAVQSRAAEIVAIDRALAKLDALDARLVQLVELRFFGGLTVDEAAEALGISPRTVKRDWQKARAFLLLELAPEGR